MINVPAAVVRAGKEEEIPLKQLVPGLVVKLSAGIFIAVAVGLTPEMRPMIVSVCQSKGVNILKCVRMGASSSFGNMFSVLGASAFLPFVPMAPIQVHEQPALRFLAGAHSPPHRRPGANRQAASPAHRQHQEIRLLHWFPLAPSLITPRSS